MSKAFFTEPDVWLNGFYELAIELGPRSDERLRLALQAIWSLDDLDGPYERNDVEPEAQPRAEPTVQAVDYAHLYGVATLPRGERVACGTFAVREEDGSDWLVLYVPMGALETVYEVGAFLFERNASSPSWRSPLDEWFVRAAKIAFTAVPFELALVGHEVSGSVSASDLAMRGLPAERGIGYLRREDSILVWYPPTK